MQRVTLMHNSSGKEMMLLNTVYLMATESDATKTFQSLEHLLLIFATCPAAPGAIQRPPRHLPLHHRLQLVEELPYGYRHIIPVAKHSMSRSLE